jgi:NO-binding membrane sensor protein with MHYT domain
MSIVGTLVGTLGAQVAKEVVPELFQKLARGRGKSAERVAEVAADAVLAATGMSADTPPENVLTALKNDPAAYARVVEATTAKAVAEIEAQVLAQQIAAEDRDSARRMNVKTQSSILIVLAIVSGFFAFAAAAAAIYLNVIGIEPTTLTTTIITAAIGFFASVIGFYFGSSAGSKDKTSAMSDEIQALAKRR